jgi:hypothetical protein
MSRSGSTDRQRIEFVGLVVAGASSLFGASVANGGGTTPACLGEMTLFHEEPRINNEYPFLVDINGDGRIDMLTIDDPRILRVYLDDGESLQLSDSFSIVAHGWIAAIRDFDNDGHPDLLVNATYGYNCGSNAVRVYWNSGDPAHPLAGDYTEIALMSVPYCIGSDPIDFDGDGLLDIITTSMPFSISDTSRKTRTTRNLGGRNFAVQADFVWPRDLYARGTNDIDGDGHADFVSTVKSGWAHGQWGTWLYRGNGDGTFGSAIVNFASPRTTHGFPFDADGASVPGSGFGVYVGTSFSQTLTLGRWSTEIDGLEFEELPIPSPYRAMFATDVTFDGLEDLVLISPDLTGRLAVMENDGAGGVSATATELLEVAGFDFLSVAVHDGETRSLYAVAYNASTIRVYRADCSEPTADCDGDGTTDAAEIAGGAADCNANGVPDDCELVDGTSKDTDFNGVPDECQDLPSLTGLAATSVELMRFGTRYVSVDLFAEFDEVSVEVVNVFDTTIVNTGGRPFTHLDDAGGHWLPIYADASAPEFDSFVTVGGGSGAFSGNTTSLDPTFSDPMAATPPPNAGWFNSNPGNLQGLTDGKGGRTWLGRFVVEQTGHADSLEATLWVSFARYPGGATQQDVASITVEYPVAPCPEDLNGDGLVTGADLGILLLDWGTDAPLSDLDADGEVDGADIGLMLLAWGTCP